MSRLHKSFFCAPWRSHEWIPAPLPGPVQDRDRQGCQEANDNDTNHGLFSTEALPRALKVTHYNEEEDACVTAGNGGPPVVDIFPAEANARDERIRIRLR